MQVTLFVTMLPWQHFSFQVPSKLWKSTYTRHVPIGKYFITIYTNISFIAPTLSSLHIPSSIKIQFFNSFFPKTCKTLAPPEDIQIKVDLGLNILKYFPLSMIIVLKNQIKELITKVFSIPNSRNSCLPSPCK